MKTKSKKSARKALRVLAHQAGSRKGRVHVTFDTKGRDAAIKHGRRLGLKDTTLRSWCSQFLRVAPTVKKVRKPKAAAPVVAEAA